MSAPPLIEVRNLRIYFPIRKGFLGPVQYVKAVDGVNLRLYDGSVLTLLGESGCGKTTLGKTIAGLYRPTAGEVLFRGKNIWRLSSSEFMIYRRSVQIVHQDPYAALNPTKTVFTILATPLKRWGIARTRSELVERVSKLLELVGLTPPEDFLYKYPHQLSGGQRQRVVIARAISVNPKLIVADEPITMIDVSLRLGILDLMLELREKMGTAYLFITHDFGAARYFSAKGGGRIAVMYLGKIVEIGPAEEIIKNPMHPYTQTLISAVPVPDPEISRKKKPIQLRSLDIPSPVNPPKGCRFHDRCPFYIEGLCDKEEPPLTEVKPLHEVACWRVIKR
ncbi:MAG: ABC transporter ATP-binding protein [Crenarchaeota archaeon]|nr:ABC transporter ATP-binding protein [Thermoproteota archaeon]